MKNFADCFVARTRELGHPLCVGIDPYLDRIPRLFCRGKMSVSSPQTSGAVLDFCLAVLDHVAGRVAIIKPQIALFEQLGWRGPKILESVIMAARDRDILVLLDAKRGDIGSTADRILTPSHPSESKPPAGRPPPHFHRIHRLPRVQRTPAVRYSCSLQHRQRCSTRRRLRRA